MTDYQKIKSIYSNDRSMSEATSEITGLITLVVQDTVNLHSVGFIFTLDGKLIETNVSDFSL